MKKCACEMTVAEILAANTDGKDLRAILVEDNGGSWTVTEYSSAAAGLGTDHVTLQSALSCAEELMVKIRRDETAPHDPSKGVVITDPQEIVKSMG